jgi:hypothetical protein
MGSKVLNNAITVALVIKNIIVIIRVEPNF